MAEGFFGQLLGRVEGGRGWFIGGVSPTPLFSFRGMRYLLIDHHALVRVLACNFVPKGYFFYSTFTLPQGKDVLLIDRKLIHRYGISSSKFVNYRRRKKGLATVRYLRTGRLGVLLATHGKHVFFENENVRDVRLQPFTVHGYSVGVSNGHAVVRIHREAYNQLRRRFTELACHRSVDWWCRTFQRFPFEGYKAVVEQQFTLLRQVNALRKRAKLSRVDWKPCIRTQRRPRRSFSSVSVSR